MINKTVKSRAAQKEQFEISVRKNRQKIQLLTMQPKFINDVVLLRRKWDIPDDGYDSYKTQLIWQKNQTQNNERYFRVDYLQFKVGHGGAVDYAEKLKTFSNDSPNNRLQQDLANLIKKFKLSPLLIEGLRGYLLRNCMPTYVGIIIEYEIDPITDMPVLKLIIQEDTSSKDVLAIWDEVKRCQKKLSYWKQEKSQPIKHFDRNRKAWELKKQGKGSSDIADMLSTDTITVSPNDVLDFVKSYETYLQKNQIQS